MSLVDTENPSQTHLKASMIQPIDMGRVCALHIMRFQDLIGCTCDTIDEHYESKTFGADCSLLIQAEEALLHDHSPKVLFQCKCSNNIKGAFFIL